MIGTLSTVKPSYEQIAMKVDQWHCLLHYFLQKLRNLFELRWATKN